MNTLKTLALTALLAAPAVFAQDAMMDHHGKFRALGAPTTGEARVTEQNGRVVVTLKNLKTEVGPDLQVWLYAGALPESGGTLSGGKYVKVGVLKKFDGTFRFTAPAGVKANDFKSVVLWCEQVKTAFAAAELM